MKIHVIQTKIILILFVIFLPSCLSNEEDLCNTITSCSGCLRKSFCTWCVTKSRCTKQSCGNDNVIYPKNVAALMSGETFCPRVADTQELVLKSGKRQKLSVKITQIYLYMAFTPWKCRINVNGKEHVIIATLLVDTVYCESFEFKNESEEPSVSGSVTVLWDYNKAFDGNLPFKVCRCDLDSSCIACT
ncbi:uncharacterized protein LOC123721197 [Papilio machaon]|nr:uncharacterized protein LOC123721197 [Papilio machaon]